MVGKHVIKQKDEIIIRYKCDICDRQFNSVKLFSLHKRVAHKENNRGVKCNHCDQVFSSDRLHNTHLLTTHKGKIVERTIVR